MMGAYGLAHAVALPGLLPFLALHPRLRGRLGQRLGWLPASLPERPVWLHGASAGDLAALHPLAIRLGQRGHPLVLSTWTRTGDQMGERLMKGVPVLRAPLDLRGPVRRALRRLQPRLLVLECLEIWPRLMAACRAAEIPVAVVNGRLSPRSLRRYARAAALFRPCFQSLAYVSALSVEQAVRFEEAGVPAHRIEVHGSSKHAGLAPALRVDPARPPRVVLGSIHRAEEEVVIGWLASVWHERPLQAVVAPRYPGRARALQRRLAALGVPSRLSSAPPEQERVEVLDSVGELRDRYRGATLAFVGGSLVRRGGHNLIEPAACGVPVLFGPSTDHCAGEAVALSAAGAGWQIGGAEELRAQAGRLLEGGHAWQEASHAALDVARSLAASAEPVAARLAALAEGAR